MERPCPLGAGQRTTRAWPVLVLASLLCPAASMPCALHETNASPALPARTEDHRLAFWIRTEVASAESGRFEKSTEPENGAGQPVAGLAQAPDARRHHDQLEPGAFEEDLRTMRMRFGASYRLARRFRIAASMPLVRSRYTLRTLASGSQVAHRSGIGDPLLELAWLPSAGGGGGDATAPLAASGFELRAGAALPLGAFDGDGLEPYAEPGAGAWRWLVGAAYRHQLGGTTAGLGVDVRLPAEAESGYRYGAVVGSNAALELHPGPWRVGFGIAHRHATKDRFSDSDPVSGSSGQVLLLRGTVGRDWGSALHTTLTAGVPAVERLDGFHDEGARFELTVVHRR